MPMNGYSVGRDHVLTITTPLGVLRIKITNFDAKPVFADLKSTPMNEPPVHMSVPSGWKGSFKIDREDNTVDSYLADIEALYWAGGNLPQGSITETIAESDGSTSRYRYTKVNLKVSDVGSWSGEKLVEQTFEFDASRRIKI